jgi:aminopeptidase N
MGTRVRGPVCGMLDECSDGWNTTYFERTPEMSAYLVAIVLSEFKYKTLYTKAGVMVCSL